MAHGRQLCLHCSCVRLLSAQAGSCDRRELSRHPRSVYICLLVFPPDMPLGCAAGAHSIVLSPLSAGCPGVFGRTCWLSWASLATECVRSTRLGSCGATSSGRCCNSEMPSHGNGSMVTGCFNRNNGFCTTSFASACLPDATAHCMLRVFLAGVEELSMSIGASARTLRESGVMAAAAEVHAHY